MRRPRLLATALAILAAGGALAAPRPEMVEPISRFVGEMAKPMPGSATKMGDIDNALRFEPLQSFDEMFLRDDVVFLMRHGPTDWSKLDIKDVAPDDCGNQRILSEQGREDMRNYGALLAFNDVKPARIIVSQWCRNLETVEMMREGYDLAAPGVFATIPLEISADLNLLLSLQGARNVTNLRRIVSEWDGSDGDGPLLVISHFTNIQELTEFSVYEGEALVIDPKRNNRVLGYLRLKTAAPDEGHFDIGTRDAIYDEDGSLREAVQN